MSEAAKKGAEPTPPVKKPTIYEAIPMITGAVAPIGKDRKGDGMPFKFRGIEDVYAALNLLLSKNGISILPEILESKHEAMSGANGKAMFRHTQRVRFHLVDSYGTHLTADAEGEGMDHSDKSTPKAASTAYKSMAFQVFCIPTGEKIDSEEESPEVDARPPAQANGNGHPITHAPAAQKAPAARGESAVTEAQAFSATAQAITDAASAGDLKVIDDRLATVKVTDGQRKVLKAQIQRKAASFQ